MPILADRPIETVRTEVIDQLIMNYSHGEISYEAFERRLDEAMSATDNETLVALTQDLTLTVDSNYRSQKKQEFVSGYDAGAGEDEDRMINILSGSNRSGVWHAPKKLSVFSALSGSTIDFTDAKFSSKVMTLRVFNVFSGDTIYIPEHVNVVSKAFCVIGSIDNQTQSLAPSNAPTIVIEGWVLCGSLEIKLKRTIKERFVAFADELKKMFS